MATIVGSAAGGTWSTTAAWAGGVVPTAADDVQFNATTGNILLNSTQACRSLDCTGYTGTFSCSNNFINLNIGDATAGTSNIALKFSSGMTFTPGSFITFAFVSTSATVQTCTFAGKTMTATGYTFSGSGKWQFTDACTLNASSISHTGGTLDTNGQAVTATQFNSTGATARTLTFGSSAITILQAFSAGVTHSGSNLTVTANTAVMSLTGNGGSFSALSGQDYNGLGLVFSGGGAAVLTNACTLAAVTVTTGNLQFTAGCTLGALNVVAAATARTLKFQISTTTTITTWNVNGQSGNLVTIISSTAGTAATLSKASGSVFSDYLSLKDSTATGGASWDAGTHSTNVSGNTGWTYAGASGPSIVGTGIASTEAFGTTTVSPHQLLVLSGIVSVGTFGSAVVAPDQTVAPTGIASAGAFGSSAVASHPLLTVPSIASAESFGSPTVAVRIVLLPSSIASVESVGTSTVTLRVAVFGVASTESFGTATVARDQVTAPSSVTSSEAFGTSVVTAGGAVVAVPSIGSAESFGSTIVALDQPITVSSVVSTEAFGTSQVDPHVHLLVSSITSAQAFGTTNVHFVTVATLVMGYIPIAS